MRLPHIGVFDSGCGGLTVLKELVTRFPCAQYLYFGDTARLPYGSKSPEIVRRYATKAVRFLEQHGSHAIVIACNTATALALDTVTRMTTLPVFGVVEPGAQEAAAQSRTRRVIVFATAATVSSRAYVDALGRYGIATRQKACPLLVPLVEEGWMQHPVTEQVARIYVDEAFTDDFRCADVLLLGCTHYPLLRTVLRRVVPDNVKIVDSAQSTARQVVETIAALELKASDTPSSEFPQPKFFVSDSAAKFCELGSIFLEHPIDNVEQVDLE